MTAFWGFFIYENIFALTENPINTEFYNTS